MWEPGRNPQLVTPNGEKVDLEVSDYVPVLSAPCVEGVGEDDDPEGDESGGAEGDVCGEYSGYLSFQQGALEGALPDALSERFSMRCVFEMQDG